MKGELVNELVIRHKCQSAHTLSLIVNTSQLLSKWRSQANWRRDVGNTTTEHNPRRTIALAQRRNEVGADFTGIGRHSY